MLARFARVIAATTAVGLLVGGVIGGVGGRLAMRVLAVTSDESLRGRATDDDELVGRITVGGTTGLIIFLAFGGVAVALVYLIVRRWLPSSRPLRAAVYGLLFFGVQGSQMFDPDSFDFSALGPRWLAVAMFSAILFGVGWFTAFGIDWAEERWPQFSMRKAYAFAPLLLLLPVFPVFLAIAVGGAIAYVIQTNDRVRAMWESRVLSLIGQAALAVVVALTCVPTIARVGDIVV